MGSFMKIIQSIFKDTIVGTLSLCFIANNVIEKVFWLLLGILGTICMGIVVLDQIKSWTLNPTVSSRKWVKLSEVDFPAITFCHQGNTRMEFPERLIKIADVNHPKIRKN